MLIHEFAPAWWTASPNSCLNWGCVITPVLIYIETTVYPKPVQVPHFSWLEAVLNISLKFLELYQERLRYTYNIFFGITARRDAVISWDAFFRVWRIIVVELVPSFDFKKIGVRLGEVDTVTTPASLITVRSEIIYHCNLYTVLKISTWLIQNRFLNVPEFFSRPESSWAGSLLGLNY